MPETCTLSIGGISINLNPDQSHGKFDFVKGTADFITQEKPEINLSVYCGMFPKVNESEISFETNISWQIRNLNSQIIISHPTFDQHQMGIFSPDFRSGAVYVAEKDGNPGQFIFPLAYPMGELFMISLLGEGLGVMVHAAGVIYKGEGYLFPGQGGAGKTTTARLWNELPGACVINDDKVIIRKREGEFMIYGTPWHGEGGFASNRSAPLKSIFLLEKADHNHVVPISPMESVLWLMNGGFLPLWDKGKMDFTLKFMNELVEVIPTKLLGFLPDQSMINFILNLPD